MKVNARTKKYVNLGFTHTFIILFGLFMIYPLAWMVFSSFRFDEDIFKPIDFQDLSFTLQNYIVGWQGFSRYTFATFYKNSFVVTFLVVLGMVVSSTLTAFAFAKLDFSGKKFFFSIMLLTLMLPKHVKIIPQYIIFSKLHWVNTFFPLIVPSFFGVQGFFIFQMVQYIRTIPNTLFEAAKMDGCSIVKIYSRIVVPLSIPTIITAVLLCFMWTWNDFFSQLLYLSDVAKMTISVALRMFIDATGSSSWGAMFASVPALYR